MNCSNITEINLFYFDTSRVIGMNAMFAYCSSLTSLNLTNLKTSQVKFMNWMFAYCSSLTSLNLSYFETSQVRDMNDMFCNCSSLTSLNLSNFDTSQLTNMVKIFADCTSLTSLDLSKFCTSNVENMHDAFANCILLTTLNLSSFDTSKVKNMTRMFSHCKLLTSLDLSNFDTSKVSDMNFMFSGCINLEYINLIKFDENELKSYNNIFDNVPENIVICINELKARSKILPQIKEITYHTIDCTNNWKTKQKKINKDREGYYLDNNLYKECFYTCKTCKTSGNVINHNCLKCNDNYPIEYINNNNYLNCYKHCSYYHYFDDENNYHCTNDFSCPSNYPKLKENKKECLKSGSKYIKDLIIKEKKETEKMSREEEIKYYDNLLKIIENGFTDDYDTSILDRGQDEYIPAGKMTVTFTTIENQKNNIKNNINNNMTSINLAQCESILKAHYHLPDNITFYMEKIDVEQKGMNIPKIEFSIFCKLNGSNLV